MTAATIEVDVDRIRMQHGLLRAQQVAGSPGWVRLGLLATTALLLGGDRVELTVRVGPGAKLDLFDVAGTVAYHGRGKPASWQVHLEVGAGGELAWAGEPFVVADGADVSRRIDADLADDAVLRLRETLVFGRAGERGGRLRNRTAIVRDGAPVLLEDQLLDPPLRELPGILGPHRVLDSLLVVGGLPDDPVRAPPGATAYRLTDSAGVLIRWLGTSAADSPLTRWR